MPGDLVELDLFCNMHTLKMLQERGEIEMYDERETIDCPKCGNEEATIGDGGVSCPTEDEH